MSEIKIMLDLSHEQQWKEWSERSTSTSGNPSKFHINRSVHIDIHIHRSGQLQLPLSSLVEEFKVAKCRVAMTFRDSRDNKVREAGVKNRSGRKWEASTALAQAEGNLKLKDMLKAAVIMKWLRGEALQDVRKHSVYSIRVNRILNIWTILPLWGSYKNTKKHTFFDVFTEQSLHL